MRKAFATNLAILLAINALVKPAYLLGVDLGVQNAVGTAAYGRYAYWFSFTFVFATVLDFGLQNYNAVTLSRSPELLRSRLPVTLSLKLVLSVLYGALATLAAYGIGATAEDLRLVGWIVLTQVALSTWQLLRANVAAQGKYRFNSLISVTDKALLLLVVGTLLLYPGLSHWITIERFVFYQFVALVIAIFVTVAGTDIPEGQRWLAWDLTEIRTLLRSAAPYALSLLLSSVAARVDILMLERLVPDADYQVGVYWAGYRLLDAINMVSYLFATLMIPMLAKLTEEEAPVKPLLYQGAQYMLVLTLGAAAWMTFYAQPVCDFLYDESTAAWGPVLAALIWSSVGTGIMYIQGSYLLVVHRIRLVNFIFLAATLLNIGLNLLLIPRYGPLGAAAATAVTQGSIAALDWWYAERITRRETTGGIGTGSVLLRAAAYVGVGLVAAWTSLHYGWSLWAAVGFQALACAAAAFGTGLLVRPRELLNFVRSARR